MGKKPKGKHFSYRPPLHLEPDLNDLAEAIGAPKTYFLDQGLEYILPELVKRFKVELEKLRAARGLYRPAKANHLILNESGNAEKSPNAVSSSPGRQAVRDLVDETLAKYEKKKKPSKPLKPGHTP